MMAHTQMYVAIQRQGSISSKLIHDDTSLLPDLLIPIVPESLSQSCSLAAWLNIPFAKKERNPQP